MKRPLVLIILTAGLSNLSMVHEPSWDLLSEEDGQIEEQDLSRGPALSAFLDGKSPYWESFNKWQCFRTDAIKLSCLETESDGTLKVPAMHFVYGSHYYEFSLDPEPRLDCEKVLNRWKYLLAEESTFCTYAALLQNIDDEVPDLDGPEANEGSAWIISQLKTSKGRWTFEDLDNWKKDDDGTSEDDQSEDGVES